MFSTNLWKYDFGLLQVSYKYTNNKFIQLRVSVNFSFSYS